MEKSYQYVKTAILTFKLDRCCWLAPIRVGLCVIAYLNILLSLISILGITNDSFSPTILKIQEVIIPDFVSKPIPILAYCTELGFNVLLLCAMYRKDIELTRVFMFYNITTIIASTLFYSMVIPAIDVLLTITIMFSLVFQIYVLVLVRSAIVKFKEEQAMKNGKVPTDFVFSTLKKEKEDGDEKIEMVEEPSVSDQESVKEDTKKEKEKLETVEEHPNEVRVELNP